MVMYPFTSGKVISREISFSFESDNTQAFIILIQLITTKLAKLIGKNKL